MVFKGMILVLAALGLIFTVGPFFNYAVFDFQCETKGCSGQICESRKIFSKDYVTTCEFLPEYNCNRDCGARSLKCGFDENFRNSCTKCVKDCKSKYEFSKATGEAMESCFNSCYNPLNSSK